MTLIRLGPATRAIAKQAAGRLVLEISERSRVVSSLNAETLKSAFRNLL